MRLRGHLLRGNAILALLVMATSLMAIVTIRLVVSSSRMAYDDLARDRELGQRVERGLRRLADATRVYVTRPDDLQRVRIDRIRRELEPEVDTLIARAHALHVPTATQIDTNMGRFVGWLALAVAEGSTLDAFEQMLGTWRPIVQLDVDAFTSVSRARGNDLIGTATGLSRRATLGIIVLSLLALLTAGVLAAHAIRRSSTNRRSTLEVPHP